MRVFPYLLYSFLVATDNNHQLLRRQAGKARGSKTIFGRIDSANIYFGPNCQLSTYCHPISGEEGSKFPTSPFLGLDWISGSSVSHLFPEGAGILSIKSVYSNFKLILSSTSGCVGHSSITALILLPDSCDNQTVYEAFNYFPITLTRVDIFNAGSPIGPPEPSSRKDP